MAHTATNSTNSAMYGPAQAALDDSDCDRVNDLVDQLADGSPLTAADEDFLYNHDDDCSPCFDDIRKQHIFVEFLTQQVGRHRSPANLHSSILAQVLA